MCAHPNLSTAAASSNKASEPRFPYKEVLILLGVNLTEPIVMAVLFPSMHAHVVSPWPASLHIISDMAFSCVCTLAVAPFMVSEWVPQDEVGTWAGMLSSVYNLASIPAAVFWGRLSDTKGRVPVMIAILVGSAVSMVVFGFAGSLTHAVLARVLGGLFSGVGALVTASLREVTKTDAHRSKAMSSISFAYGVGFSIGPMLGGILIRPTFLRGTALSIFDTFPYLLPCTVIALLILCSGVGLYWLPPPAPPPVGLAAGLAAGTATTRTSNADAVPDAAAAPADEEAPATVDKAPATVEAMEEGDGRTLLASSSASQSRRTRWFRLIRQPVTVLLTAYLVMNFGSIGSMETFPLYLTRNDTSGLGLSPVGLGEVLLPQSFVIFLMPLVYPLIAKRAGHEACFYIGCCAIIVFNVGLPLLLLVQHLPTAMWAGLMALGALRGTAGPLIYPAMIIIFNQAVSERLGFWNGVLNSVGSSARAGAPFIFGCLFALGTEHGHASFPFDVSMPFILSMLSMAMAMLLVYLVPRKEAEKDQAARFATRTRPCTLRRWWRCLLPARPARATRTVASSTTSGAELSTSRA